MELNIGLLDLKPEYQDINTSETKFEHFLPKVQDAIKVVGRALFRRSDTHNAIYPPKSEVSKILDKLIEPTREHRIFDAAWEQAMTENPKFKPLMENPDVRERVRLQVTVPDTNNDTADISATLAQIEVCNLINLDD